MRRVGIRTLGRTTLVAFDAHMRRVVAAITILLGSLLLLALLDFAGAVERLEILTRDARVATGIGRQPPAADLLLCWIDQDSMDAVRQDGFGFPWPRDIYADGLRYIASGQPKAIVLDILWSEPRENAEEDREFGRTLQAITHDVHAFKFVDRREGGLHAEETERFAARGRPLPEFLRDSPDERGLVLPIPEIATGADVLGFVNVRPDADKVFRHYDLARRFRGQSHASLGLAAVQLARPDFVPPAARIALNFRGPEFTYPKLKFLNVAKSAAQVEANEKPLVDRTFFRDKIVIVGIHADGYEDITATPTSRVFPGPELHATAIDNLLHGDWLRELPLAWPLAGLLAAAATAAVFLVPSAPGALVAALALLAGLVAAGLLLLARTGILPLAAPALAWGFASGGAFFYRLVVEGRQKRELKRAFTSYMAPEVVAEVLAHPEGVRLGGEKRQLTLFFTDLAGFTTLAERAGPEPLVAFLNDYFTRMCAHVMREKGVVDKFIGDAIMALFGAPLARPDHGLAAVRAALAMQAENLRLDAELVARGWPAVQTRIGIHAGEAIVGNMGSQSRFDYTAIGDAVNLASRLEGANKAFGTRCLVSETAWAQAAGEIAGREVGRVRVVGRGAPIAVYEPFGPAAGLSDVDRHFLDSYDAALASLRSGAAEAARKAISALASARPRDGVLQQYLTHLANPAWDGVFSLDSK